jgi:hypothetical protein
MELFDRRLRRASSATRSSVGAERRMLNGSPFLVFRVRVDMRKL